MRFAAGENTKSIKCLQVISSRLKADVLCDQSQLHARLQLSFKSFAVHNDREMFCSVAAPDMPIPLLSKTPAVASLVTLSVALLAGCATPPPPEASPDPAAVRLKELLHSTRKLSAGSAGANAAEVAAKPETLARAMSADKLTLQFPGGSAAELLRPLAAARGLQFKVLGPQPHLPLYVTLDVTDVSIEDVLTDVAAQFGQRAALALTDTSIEIRYRQQRQ